MLVIGKPLNGSFFEYMVRGQCRITCCLILICCLILCWLILSSFIPVNILMKESMGAVHNSQIHKTFII